MVFILVYPVGLMANGEKKHQFPMVLFYLSVSRALILMREGDKPGEVACKVSLPGWVHRIMAMAKPLKAFRFWDGNEVKSMGLPLSVATISPEPEISK